MSDRCRQVGVRELPTDREERRRLCPSIATHRFARARPQVCARVCERRAREWDALTRRRSIGPSWCCVPLQAESCQREATKRARSSHTTDLCTDAPASGWARVQSAQIRSPQQLLVAKPPWLQVARRARGRQRGQVFSDGEGAAACSCLPETLVRPLEGPDQSGFKVWLSYRRTALTTYHFKLSCVSTPVSRSAKLQSSEHLSSSSANFCVGVCFGCVHCV